MERLQEFLRDLTIVEGGKSLQYIAKLEAESGIDLEDLAKSAKVEVTDKGSKVVFSFDAYDKKHSYAFMLNPAQDRILIGTKYQPLNSMTKVLLFRTIIVPTMRGAPRDKLWRQQLHQRVTSVQRFKKFLNEDDMATIFESMLRGNL